MISRIYNHRTNTDEKTKDVAFSYLTSFYEKLPTDYQNAKKRLAWDNKTLGEMTSLMAQNIRSSFGAIEDAMARSSMALAALFFEHGTNNLRVAINLPATWPDDEEDKGFLSIQFIGFAETPNSSTAHQISLVNPKKNINEERIFSFYPVDDNFHEKLGGLLEP